MGGKAARDKGSRVERAIVDRFRQLGVRASRVPLSGAAGGDYSGDVVAEVITGQRWVGEVKARKGGAGWVVLTRWLGTNQFLVLQEDRQEPLVAMRWSQFAELVRSCQPAPEGGCPETPD